MAEFYISAPFLTDKASIAVMDALGADVARYVGGAVRDAVLERSISDVDIATSLDPKTVMMRLKMAGLKAIPTGFEHGTVTAVSDHRPFEITTLRRDIKTDGRRAEVAFTDDWKADAKRRDFTMNALYADAYGRVYDYMGGLADLKAGRVRFIGDPYARIREDALRILRFFRFHAYYGGDGLDPDGLTAAIAERGRLDILSVERVREEILRLLKAVDPLPVLTAMAEGQIVRHVLPEWDGDAACVRLARLIAREEKTGFAADSLHRLAALVRVEDLAGLGRRWRFSKAEQARLAAMAIPCPQTDRHSLQLAIYRDGAQAVCDRILLADHIADPSHALAVADSWIVPSFPVAGRDLLKLGFMHGPFMGEILRRLEDRWIESGFTMTKDALLCYAQTIKKQPEEKKAAEKGARDA